MSLLLSVPPSSLPPFLPLSSAANQETVLELISFFQRAVPRTLLTGEGEGNEEGGTSTEEQTAIRREREGGGTISTVLEQVSRC